MLLALGDHHFDVTHRALVVAWIDSIDSLERDGAGCPEAVAVPSASMAHDVCERVGVPVGVAVSRDKLDFDGRTVASVGPFAGAAPERMAGVVEAIVAGERVIVSDDVRRDRRVAEVMARILAARARA